MPDSPSRPASQMEADLRELVATVQSPQLRGLLDTLIGPQSPTWPAFRDAPAAKRYHQAYTHGLLEHSLTVAQAVGALAAVFGGVDRDLAVTAAVLHDIGKIDAYDWSGETIEMSDLGRLHGEIPLGYLRIRDAIAVTDGFPAPLAEMLLHIILSHHGSLEHGSPVVPATREATLVHMADNLGSKLGSFDRLEESRVDGSPWAGQYDRALGTVAYLGLRDAGDPSGPAPAAAGTRRAA